MIKTAFDNKLYVKEQSEHIKQRISQFENKLYLEFGGKLFDDYHAARVLPGFEPDSKLKMLLELKDNAEIIIAIRAKDIEEKRIRGDFDITYEDEVFRLASSFREAGLKVDNVVITQYSGQNISKFKERAYKTGLKVSIHYIIENYPNAVEEIISAEGFGKNDFIKTNKPLVIVTAPGPSSGKMAVCLSQMYHENKHGVKAGYAKFETFPIWNLPLEHPVNLAYEAATADLNDINMIDPFHLEKYSVAATNYNRDIKAFPILSSILKQITGKNIYHSPTDMGVNRCGFCIIDDIVVRKASQEEIHRRLTKAENDFKKGRITKQNLLRNKLVFDQINKLL